MAVAVRGAVAARMGVMPPRAALHSVRPRPLGGRACISAWAVGRSRPQRAVLLRARASEAQPAGEGDDDGGTEASKAADKALDALQMGDGGPDERPRDEWVRSCQWRVARM